MKRVKEGIVRCTANLNQMIFYVRSMSNTMGGSGPIVPCRFLRLEAEGHPGLREQFWSFLRGPPRCEDAKDIATQMAGIFGLGFE